MPFWEAFFPSPSRQSEGLGLKVSGNHKADAAWQYLLVSQAREILAPTSHGGHARWMPNLRTLDPKVFQLSSQILNPEPTLDQ